MSCTSGIVAASGSEPDKYYRYFNQPIEQIPNWQSSVGQILVHHDNGGLMWKNTECLDVVTCIKLSSSGLVIERKNVMIITMFDDVTTPCDTITTTECPSGTGGTGGGSY